jgi:hypothetical protein
VDGIVCAYLSKPQLTWQVHHSGVVTMESPGAQYKSSKDLISDAPSELEAQCHSISGKIFNFVPGNDTRNVSVRSHSWIVVGTEPDTHHFMSRFVYKKG